MNKKYFFPAVIAVIALLTFFAAYAKQQRNNLPMQAWEYTSLIIARGAINNGQFSVWYEATGENVKELSLPVSVPAKAQELGNQGWELISVTPVSNHTSTGTAGFTSQIIYIFKRPK